MNKESIAQDYETVIGLEIHVQMKTESKAFCGDANAFTDQSNTHISPISLAHPGTLPKANSLHLMSAIKLGVALNCEIAKNHMFDRKHYFYPDLPKGYQLTQDSKPYCRNGKVTFFSEGQEKSIRLHHIHMEEDAGKSIHSSDGQNSMLDYNRAGVPLLEIVTEPDFRSGQEVYDFLAELQRIVQYLGISDANMEEGSFRCDCNVSVRKYGAEYGERCEIKNQNSRRFAKQAIEYEAHRQIAILEKGGVIERSTMLFDPTNGETRPMRKKESVNDYRYFPDPDLPAIETDKALVKAATASIGLLPYEAFKILVQDFDISSADAEVIIQEKSYTEALFPLLKEHSQTKLLTELYVQKIIPHIQKSNLLINDFLAAANINSMLEVLSSSQVSKSAALQHIVPRWLDHPNDDAMRLAQQLNLVQSDDQSFLDDIIIEIVKAFPDKVAEYKKGKKGLIGFFMGQVKARSSGQADPKAMQEKLEKALA